MELKMDKEQKREQLRCLEQELEEDIDILVASITDLEDAKPNGWERAIKQAKETKKQLEKNLWSIQSQLDPTMQDSDEDSFNLLTDRMIHMTISEYFRYHIWTHPDMIAALEDFQRNDASCFDGYSNDVRKWMVVFGAKKYHENKLALEEDFHVNHKQWVCLDDPGNPFSFNNCVEFRGILEPKKLKGYLDEMAEWDLETLITRHDIFQTTIQRKEKETIMEQREE